MSTSLIRGANYLACAGTVWSNYGIFLDREGLGSFDCDVLCAELDVLLELGCKHIRLFQSCYGFWIDRAQHIDNLRTTARAMSDRGMSILLVLFDGVNVNPGFAVNPASTPWYDLYGFHGERRWDPEAATNPGLSNAAGTGILDAWKALDEAGWESRDLYKGFKGGFWPSTPDDLYLMTFDVPIYPSVPAGHGAYWTGIRGFIEQTIQAVRDEGILQAVDCWNEPELMKDRGPSGVGIIDLLVTEPSLVEFSGNVYADPAARAAQALARYAAAMKWVLDCVADLFPGVPRTMGHVTHSDPPILFDPAAGLIRESAPEFISTHDYGACRLLENTVRDTKAYYAAWDPPREWVLSEFYRCDAGPGDLALLHGLHWLSKHEAGGYMWDLFETSGFGTSLDQTGTVHIPGGGKHPGSRIYPVTGMLRSLTSGKAHQIVRRREDLLPYITRWLQGEKVELPPYHRVVMSGFLSFALVDQEGLAFPACSDTRIVWRWAIMDADDIGAERTSGTFSWYPALGLLLDVSAEKVTYGSAYLDLTSEVDLNAIDPGRRLVVHAAIGTRPYTLDTYEKLRYLDTLHGAWTREELLQVEPPLD